MVEYEIGSLENLKTERELVVIPVFEEDGSVHTLKELYPNYFYSSLAWIAQEEDFKGKQGTHCLIYDYASINGTPKRILLWGLGKEEDFDIMTHREEAGNLAKFIRGLGSPGAAIKVFADPSDSQRVRATIEGLVLGSYEFGKYKTEKKEEDKDKLKVIKILAEINTETEEAFRIGRVLAENTNLARDLTNEPPNNKKPSDFVKWAKEVVSNSNGKLRLWVFDKNELSCLGFNLLLSVAEGSVNPPYLLIIEHKPANYKNSEGPYVFVGKGLCYDSGGLNLKQEDHLKDMKMDMAGGAAVLFALKAIAELELPFWVVGYIPVLENMPSGSAYKPDNIIRSYNGKTVEIINTDAEGRLVLYDVLAYAQDIKKGYLKTKPKLLVDLATLTGSCIVALGCEYAGVMGNNQEFINKFIRAGEESGERLWQLPMDKKFGKKIESKVADLKHLYPKREAGAIIGACVLEKAIEEGQDWVHIDCAGPAIPDDGMASGYGLRLFVQFLLDLIRE